MTHRSGPGAGMRAWLHRAAPALSGLALVVLALFAVDRAEGASTSTLPSMISGDAVCMDVKSQRKEIAVDPVLDGGPSAFGDGTLTGTYTRSGDGLAWTSDDLPVDYVLVRGGGATNAYQYPGGTMSDAGLVAPDGAPIDAVRFCYDNQNRGRLTIVKQTEPDGSQQRFGFHASGDLAPADFTLADDESIDLRPQPGTYTVTEADTPGWKVGSIVCDDPDSTGSGRTATVEVGAGEQITCTFTNAKDEDRPVARPPVVKAPDALTPPAPAPPVVQARIAAQAVRAARASRRSSARLRPPNRCVSGTFRLTVTGSPVRQIAFTVNGRRVRTLVARGRQRSFGVTLPAGRGTVQRVSARVTFSNGARSRTLRTTVLRCAQRPAIQPQFTG